MKKPIITLLFLGGSLAVCAQDTTSNATDTYRNTQQSDVTSPVHQNKDIHQGNHTMNQHTMNDRGTTITSTQAYSAYAPATNIPANINKNFSNEFPEATDAQWEQSNEWWRVRYRQNNQDMTMYYNNNGQGFSIALPVMQTYIPDDVVSKVRSMYGYNIYDIMQIRGVKDTAIYHVRILDNGQLRSEYINAEGMAVTEIYRTESSDEMNSTQDGMHQMQNNSGDRHNGTWNNTNNNGNNQTGTESSGAIQNNTNQSHLNNTHDMHQPVQKDATSDPVNQTTDTGNYPEQNTHSNSSTNPMNTPDEKSSEKQHTAPDNNR